MIFGLAPSSLPTKPAHFDIERVIRPNILALHPYRCARDDYKEGILLDANENALGHSIPAVDTQSTSDGVLSWALDLNLHRYPDPSHDDVKARIVELRGLPNGAIDHVFLGVGSDEVIDLIMRVCVVPGKESIMITKPTYGMYSVCAQVNDIAIVNCPLEVTGQLGEGGDRGRFSLRVDEASHPITHELNCLREFGNV
jgi:histidinol-phosphate aminotransferase